MKRDSSNDCVRQAHGESVDRKRMVAQFKLYHSDLSLVSDTTAKAPGGCLEVHKDSEHQIRVRLTL